MLSFTLPPRPFLAHSEPFEQSRAGSLACLASISFERKRRDPSQAFRRRRRILVSQLDIGSFGMSVILCMGYSENHRAPPPIPPDQVCVRRTRSQIAKKPQRE